MGEIDEKEPASSHGVEATALVDDPGEHERAAGSEPSSPDAATADGAAPAGLGGTTAPAPSLDATTLPAPGPYGETSPAFHAAEAPVSTAGPPSLPSAPPSVRFLAIVAGISVALDLGTKLWAKETLSGPDKHARAARRFHVIADSMDFIFAQNPGGAWSFLRSLPDSLRRPFFLVVSAAAIVFIVTIYGRVRREQWAMRWGLPLALGGAIGNLVDRIRYGWVVDFVDVYVKRGDTEHHWPTFNVADIAIVVGVALMAFEMLRPRRDRHAPFAVAPPAVAPPAPEPPPADVVSGPVPSEAQL